MDDDVDTPKNLLNVRRKHCFKDAINKLCRPGFISSRRLSVRFADNSGQSEGAVDLGGPLVSSSGWQLLKCIKCQECLEGMKRIRVWY